MVVILFRSKLTASAGLDYSGMNDELEGYVRNQPGFLDVKGFTALDGERLTVVWWEDKETLQAWQQNQRHVEAKKEGRKKWYEYYKMEVAEVFRQSRFDRADRDRLA